MVADEYGVLRAWVFAISSAIPEPLWDVRLAAIDVLRAKEDLLIEVNIHSASFQGLTRTPGQIVADLRAALEFDPATHTVSLDGEFVLFTATYVTPDTFFTDGVAVSADEPVTCEWDLNGDGKVCQIDLGIMLSLYGFQYDQSDLGGLLSQYNGGCGDPC
jgi:hypothetical protein